MRVHVASCGNPDHYQDPDQPLYGCEPEPFIPVKSLEDASAVCREFIIYNNLGGGNWVGGTVVDESGKRIAKIAYNGRVIN